MFQLVGYRSWNAARKERIISVEHVRQGSQIAKEEFDSRVLEATYAELSKGDISFLQTMNEEGETSRAEVTERAGKKPAWVSTYKKRLLEAGVIEEPSPGVFEYALPGMGGVPAESRLISFSFVCPLNLFGAMAFVRWGRI